MSHFHNPSFVNEQNVMLFMIFNGVLCKDQYAMIMEICQTLLLYTEPKKREKEDRFEKMKFRMQLSTGEDTKGDIQQLQECVRYLP